MKIIISFNENYIEYQSNGDKNKIFFMEGYLYVIRQYLSNIINDHKAKGEWKIQLTMKINSISFKDSNKTHTMYTTSNNTEIMIGYETDEIIEELYESLLKKYQERLQKSL